MSSCLPESENAAPPGSVMSPEAWVQEGDGTPRYNNKESRWHRPQLPLLRSKSASLLTQALDTNYEADELAVPTSSPLSTLSAPVLDPTQPFFPKPIKLNDAAERPNGLGVEYNALSGGDNMAMVAPPGVRDLRSPLFDNSTPPSSITGIPNLRDPNLSFTNHRKLLNTSRGRGTSLERTEKEKRTGNLPNGLVSINPGDTGMSRPTTADSVSNPDSISTTPPTDGVRARYRSWRDARPAVAERAWSIDQQGSDDNGQVENSIKEALAGVEPNSRSRKASHSLRFFKEGLPEDKSRRQNTKKRGLSKEGTSYAKLTNVSGGGLSKQYDEFKQNDQSGTSSPLASPAEYGRPSPKLGYEETKGLHKDLSDAGYFNTSHASGPLSEELLKRYPAQLLADIRKNHNLTPGGSKGTSFSGSIPVTTSEKSYSGSTAESHSRSNLKSDNDLSGEILVPHTKNDDDDDSGEEQISSAFFVPHQTPHESPERGVDDSKPSARPKLQPQENADLQTSQQWLEEHSVPSREIDEKYLTDEIIPQALKPPFSRQSLTPVTEDEMAFPSLPDLVEVGSAPRDEDYLSRQPDAGVSDEQESDTTPVGSLKREAEISHKPPKLHDHQKDQQQPLEAIELIPYRHQVGGHTTMWRFSKRAVCKQLNNRENEFYEKVERYHPKLLKFLPRYIGVLNVKFEKQRRKVTKKNDSDEKGVQQVAQNGTHNSDHTEPGAEVNSANGHASDAGHTRVISQSIQSSSVPIPTVTFADNRHIIPKSFLRPNWNLGELQHRSKSDSDTATRSHTGQAQPPLPDGEFTFRQDGPLTDTDTSGQKRPTLEDKHSDSWGSTIKNKDLRNKVFDEAFLQQPIPIQHHRKPASQRRSLPNRHGSVLRASNSESSLKAAQQSQPSAQPAEESMRRRALKSAAENRRSSLLTMTPLDHTKEEASKTAKDITILNDKTGTSAPEVEVTNPEDSPKGKRQRRYSSGGLRRKPTEVADDRGNLKYFEEADDAGYKGDGEEEVFAMDPEPSNGAQTSSTVETDHASTQKDQSMSRLDSTVGIPEASMLPAGPREPEPMVDISRPINPKEAQTQQGSRVEYFLLLEDLTAGMKKPCIMDLKMGTRQYGVEANEKKQRSQRQKCAATTSKELGVRVCGLQVWDVKTQKYIFQDKYFGRDLKAGRQFQNALQRFLYDGLDYSSVLRRIPTILRKLAELEVIIETLKGYRFYAASLLMFYDGDTAEEGESDSTATEKDMGSKRKDIDFKMADFANCVVKEEFPTHPPCPPRHPDSPDKGFLRGLKSLRRYFLTIQEELQRKELGYSKEEVRDLSSGILTMEPDMYDDEADLSY